MKVLKPGRKQKGWAGEFECTGHGNGGGGCGATLLVEYDDLYKTYRSCMGERDEFNTFTCASCGVETDIDYSGPNERTIQSKVTWKKKNRKNEI